MTAAVTFSCDNMDPFKKELERSRILENESMRPTVGVGQLMSGVGLDAEDGHLSQIQFENLKLKHRLNMLNKAIANEKFISDASCRNSTDTTQIRMISIIDHLTDLFTSAIKKTYHVDAPVLIVPIMELSQFGDYLCLNSVPLASAFKCQGRPADPYEIAKSIIANLHPSPLISLCQIVHPGYINIFLKKSFGAQVVRSILRDGVRPPKIRKKRVVVDFSSPNIGMEMNVGHLRSTIIGDSICRLLEFLDHDVLRINHVGDWGTQIGMLIANFFNVSVPVSNLQAYYKESKARFDSEEYFKKCASDCIVKLQNGHPDSKTVWELIRYISRNEFQKIYDRLGVRLTERGESFYQKDMQELIIELEEKGYLEEDKGRKIMWPKEPHSGKPLTIVKSDGSYTYDTSDLAAIRQRLHDENADWLIYVTDSDQSMHFEMIFACAEKIGVYDPARHRIDHVGFGDVMSEDGKMFKTLSGDNVKLSDLLDEGVRRAGERLMEKNRNKLLTKQEFAEIQESVAYSCIKYSDLMHNRTQSYTFSFDKMLEDRGNTAVYLLHAYTRIKSIARNLGADYIEKLPSIISTTSIPVDHEKEWKLVKVIMKFSDTITKIIKDLHLNYLCKYTFELCSTFDEFYDSCYCIEKNDEGAIVKINDGRILLCEATLSILRQSFDILGLKPVSKI